MGQEAVITYQQLLLMVCQVANFLISAGVGKGDDVTIYMPMIPELPAIMVGCGGVSAGSCVEGR